MFNLRHRSYSITKPKEVQETGEYQSILVDVGEYLLQTDESPTRKHQKIKEVIDSLG